MQRANRDLGFGVTDIIMYTGENYNVQWYKGVNYNLLKLPQIIGGEL